MSDFPSSERRWVLLRVSARDRWSAGLVVGAAWAAVGAAGVAGVDWSWLWAVGFVVVVSGVALWRAWRPVVFVEGDRLVVRNFFSRRVLSRDSVRRFRIGRLGFRTRCVWVVTASGSVPVDAAARPRGFPGARDLDLDVAVLNGWLSGGVTSPPPSVPYLP